MIFTGFWIAAFINFNDPDQQFRIFPRMRTYSSLKIYSYVPPHITAVLQGSIISANT